LEETQPEKKHRRDPGLELGHWLVNRCWGSRVQLPDHSDVDVKEKYFDAPPGYETAESSPCLRPVDDGLSADCDLEGQKSPAPKAFTRQVILAIVAYGILA
jgi:hypothetical protein